jgi:hypothetical protein
MEKGQGWTVVKREEEEGERGGGVAQGVEHLPSKLKALSSNSSIIKKKKKKKPSAGGSCL